MHKQKYGKGGLKQFVLAMYYGVAEKSLTKWWWKTSDNSRWKGSAGKTMTVWVGRKSCKLTPRRRTSLKEARRGSCK